MTLYIHFGIYKAGSSFLQYICTNQRNFLIENKIFFPKSKEDSKMKEGLISKGNADGLNEALQAENVKKVTEKLKSWHCAASRLDCKAVLISSEALVHKLAIDKQVNLLLSAVKNAGFTKVKTMGFFRDLADHALSTYKHRAKSGTLADYKHWVSEIYETPKLIDNLCKVINDKKEIDWEIRKFQKDSNFLKQAFFKDWLKIDIPKFETRPNVNESLNLSEVKILNHLKKTHPLVIDYFINDLKSVPKKLKAKDNQLENYMFNVFARLLNVNFTIITKFNFFLNKNEQLQVGNPNDQESIEPSISINDRQLKIITENIIFFNTFSGKIVLLRRFLVNLFRK